MSAGTIRFAKSMGWLQAGLMVLLFALAGCKESPGTPQAGKAAAATEPVSVEAIAAQAKGFSVGSTMSVRTVYVFFDPKCPHCAALWQAAKPLKAQARFVWIPIALNSGSEAQGATILAASDPVAAMDQHEAAFQKGGITAASNIDEQKAQVQRNTDLHAKYGFAGVPTIVAKHAQTGALITHEGSLPTTALAQLLGLSPAAEQAR